ncbi:MAG: 4-hydroxy-tetrahydrodipicolinate synthase [Parvularculaceae bacterium]
MATPTGSLTALVTPFDANDIDAIDEDAFQKLVDRQIAGGAAGVCPAGTTGESATLSHGEHRRVIALAVEAAAGRAPVYAGAGSNNTAEAIELARFAEAAGADGLLSVTGYYNKPTQAGLRGHFKALHDAVGLPIILYNVPGRTVANLTVETIAELSRLPRIVGVKDATGDLARVALQRLASGPDFVQRSGEDMSAVGFNAMGGRGCIGVTANVAPELCARMQRASLAGDYAAALALQDRLAPLHDAMFVETNPGPAKYALSLLGLCSPRVRSPLAEPEAPAREAIRAALEGLGLIA